MVCIFGTVTNFIIRQTQSTVDIKSANFYWSNTKIRDLQLKRAAKQSTSRTDNKVQPIDIKQQSVF